MRAGRWIHPLTVTVALATTGMLALPGFGSAHAATVPAPVATAGVPTPPDSLPADDRLLVTVDPGTTASQAQAIAAEAGAVLETRAGDTLILDPTSEVRASSALVDALPGVRVVESNMAVHAFAAPNDPLYPDQYGLSNTQPGGIRAESGWATTRGSRSVVVGVLDSGIALSHPDLAANLWTNRTGIKGCGYGTHGWNALANSCNASDDAGHGTVVAGIVGAVGNNNRGVSGVAQQVSLMSLKMLNRDGDGTIADAVEAIDWALGAKTSGVNLRVLQASWGTPVSSSALSAAIGRANTAGVLFVTAAGNGVCPQATDPRCTVGQNLDTIDPVRGPNDTFPCEDTHANVICVAASTTTGFLADFSNYGANAVDIAAPGLQIMSTVPTGLCNDDAEYCRFDGTSMAAPMVSGGAVDIIAAEPSISLTDLTARILDSAAPLGSLTGLVATDGRLDVCAALPNCDGQPAVPPTAPTNVRALARNGSVTLRWGLPDSNGNAFSITGYDIQAPAGLTGVNHAATSITLTGLTNNQNAVVRVRAFGTGGVGPWVSKTVRPHVGGYEVDGAGTIRRIGIGGALPSGASGGPHFAADLARGIALVPEGTGGYVVDAYGGLHRFRIGATSPMPPAATGGPYWLGWDIVRGVTVSPNGGGFVLDGFGGLHRFGFGAGAPPSRGAGGPYWPGFDIARGVTLNDTGTGGYVADGYGGIHRFRIGAGALPAAATGGPYWPGWNIVRGITLVPGSGGGWMLDGFGGLHRFAAGGAKPGNANPAPYWPGQDIARGVAL